MKSFRLHVESKTELIQSIFGLLIGVGVFLALQFFHIDKVGWRILLLFSCASFVAYLIRGSLSRSLRAKYPTARLIGLLAVGITISTFGVFARFLIPGADDGWFTLAFVLAAGGFIGAFVILNRKDPDVMK